MLGVGSFGYVRLASHRDSGTGEERVLALKAMRKDHLVKKRQVGHVLNERWVGQALHHPFVCTLISTYQDEAHLYMLTEALMGGELFSLLCTYDTFDAPTARFYLAQVVCAFESLGNVLGVVYRDLKPENLLLDSQGYIRLVDFGFAKQVDDGVTFTLCGTPEYISPEMVTNRGHGLGCDWWATGVLLYEVLTGTTPFAHDSTMEVYTRIVQCSYAVPADVPMPAADLISQLLEPSVAARLGCLKRGPAGVKEHPFFYQIDWERLVAKAYKAPWVPQLANGTDTYYFDEYGDKTPWDNEDLSDVRLSAVELAMFNEF